MDDVARGRLRHTHTRRLASLLTDHTLNDVNHIAAKILRHMYLSADEAVPTQKTHRPTVGQQLTSGDVTGNTNRFQKHNRTVQTDRGLVLISSWV